jgi:hypothetical protein
MVWDISSDITPFFPLAKKLKTISAGTETTDLIL